MVQHHPTVAFASEAFFDRPADVNGTMKKGYITTTQDGRSLIHFIPKRPNDDPSFILRQYQMLKKLQSYRQLPSIRWVQLLRHPEHPIVLVQEHVPDGRVIKPHQDIEVLLHMLQAFLRRRVGAPEQSVAVVFRKMIHDIDAMIRVFSRESLLIEDLQWIVSPHNLSLRIIDPLHMIYLNVGTGTCHDEHRAEIARCTFGRKLCDFNRQQSDLVAIRNAIAELIGDPIAPSWVPVQRRAGVRRKPSHAATTVETPKKRSRR